MSFESGKLPACRYVPELDGAVPISTSESFSIGGKGNGQDLSVLVSFERGKLLACRYVPELDDAVPTSASESFSIRGKGNGQDSFNVNYSKPENLAPVSLIESGKLLAWNPSNGISPYVQSLTVLSLFPPARVFPSGEKATDEILSPCPLRVASTWRVATSQSRTSVLPLAMVFPSGEKATDKTLFTCPLRVPSSSGVSLRPRA